MRCHVTFKLGSWSQHLDDVLDFWQVDWWGGLDWAGETLGEVLLGRGPQCWNARGWNDWAPSGTCHHKSQTKGAEIPLASAGASQQHALQSWSCLHRLCWLQRPLGWGESLELRGVETSFSWEVPTICLMLSVLCPIFIPHVPHMWMKVVHSQIQPPWSFLSYLSSPPPLASHLSSRVSAASALGACYVPVDHNIQRSSPLRPKSSRDTLSLLWSFNDLSSSSTGLQRPTWSVSLGQFTAIGLFAALGVCQIHFHHKALSMGSSGFHLHGCVVYFWSSHKCHHLIEAFSELLSKGVPVTWISVLQCISLFPFQALFSAQRTLQWAGPVPVLGPVWALLIKWKNGNGY